MEKPAIVGAWVQRRIKRRVGSGARIRCRSIRDGARAAAAAAAAFDAPQDESEEGCQAEEGERHDDDGDKEQVDEMLPTAEPRLPASQTQAVDMAQKPPAQLILQASRVPRAIGQ